MKRQILVCALTCFGLASCAGEPQDDLRRFVKESDGLPHAAVSPLPGSRPYEPVAYSAYDLRDPFKPYVVEAPLPKPPLASHPREALEAYALENLRMVGTMQQDNVIYALVKSPDKNLFRVTPGNYMGQDLGRITEITESEITLTETVLEHGAWTERVNRLRLAENAGNR